MPGDVTGNEKCEWGRENIGELPSLLGLVRILWYRAQGQPAAGRVPNAPTMNLWKRNDQNPAEDRHWTPVKPA